MDTQHPVLRPWIRSAEVQGECGYENWNTTTKTDVLMKLFNLENGLYRVQSGVFLTKFGHILLLSLSAQLHNV